MLLSAALARHGIGANADTLMAQHQLANALENTGDAAQALALCRQTLAERPLANQLSQLLRKK